MSLLNFLKISQGLKITSEELLEERVCPNCWGNQEWDGKFVEYVQDRQKDILNKDHEAQKAFVQKFIENQVTGIRLKAEGDYLQCPTCKTRYKFVSSKAN